MKRTLSFEDALLPRVLLNFFLCIAIFFLPAWVALLFAFLLIALFEAPEALLWTFMGDLLYGFPREIFWGNELFLTTCAALFFVAVIAGRRYLRIGF